MTFLISTQTLDAAWTNAQDIARQMKASTTAQRNASAAGAVGSSSILNFERELRSYRDRLDAISALPNIAAYVAAQADTPAGYNVSTEFNGMRTALVSTINWIRANFPTGTDGTGTYLLERSWGPDGTTERLFSTATLANYRTQLDALLAAIG